MASPGFFLPSFALINSTYVCSERMQKAQFVNKCPIWIVKAKKNHQSLHAERAFHNIVGYPLTYVDIPNMLSYIVNLKTMSVFSTSKPRTHYNEQCAVTILISSVLPAVLQIP